MGYSICGRTREIEILNQIYHSDKAEFLALYGRRRIGKTYLINQFFDRDDALFFRITGTKNASKQQQLDNFISRLGKVFYGKDRLRGVSQWRDAFEMLTEAIEDISKEKKVALFFDELPWLATHKSGLLQSLEYYWNEYWSHNPRIKLIVCGSSASWIIKKIINNKAGLHNRITERILLKPFKLVEVKEFLENKGVNLTNQQILSLYCVTGGVPYYLSKVRKGLSAAQIIEELAFTQNALLIDEFDNLFSSLFDDFETHIKIIRIVAEHRHGILKNRIIKQVGSALEGSGGLKKLNELEDAGFIMKFKPLYHKNRGVYYRLVDEYAYFYLKWIEPIRDTLQRQSLDEGAWASMQSTPRWYAFSGYAFESICYKHIIEIRRALKLPATALASSWQYLPRAGSNSVDAQVDLLFDREDGATTLIEIKNTQEPFLVNKEYSEKLSKKLAVFKAQTRTKKQLFLVLLSANGLIDNPYSDALISQCITLESLFAVL